MVSHARLLGQAYLQHLGDEDLRLLGASADVEDAAAIRRRPEVVASLLDRPGMDRQLGPPDHGGPDWHPASPFLVFALAVHRTAHELATATYVTEWLGPHQRMPVFDVADLRGFLADPWRRLFLAELLASYTHVSSGSVMVATRRGVRRQRFSELDPVRLAGLLEVVPEAERPGIYRRLGDLALFLTGVFPDHTASNGLSGIDEGRLLRAGRLHGAPGRAVLPGLADAGAVELLGMLGRRWYQLAFELVPAPAPLPVRVVGELGERFGDARRVLNVLTDRYLFPLRSQWFGAGPV